MSVASSNNRINVTIKPKKSVMVNQSGLIAVRKLSDLIDVDTTGKKNGSLLIYDEEQDKFVASTLLDKQEINGGQY
jgi:hypothetical protein